MKNSIPVTVGDELLGIQFAGNFPTEEDRQKLMDEHFYQRAVQLCLATLAGVSMFSMKKGSEEVFSGGYNILPVWKSRMDANCKVPTPNCDVIYAMSYLDLKKDGPLVVQAPPQIMGMLSDFWQRPLSDVGFMGPDQGKGGMYLLVPPHYDGPPLPSGYYTLHSPTYNVFLFWRAFLERGDMGPGTRAGVAHIEKTLIYPLRESNYEKWKQMEFPDASGVKLNMLYPRDASFFDVLSELVQYEPVDSVNMYVRGMMASLGIIDGKPFQPNKRLKEILERAVKVAHKLTAAVSFTPDSFPGRVYYTGAEKRMWLNGFPNIDENFCASSYLNIDQQMSFFSVAYSASPAMAQTVVGLGAKFPGTFWDADGNYLSGEHTYHLHLPANPPAKAFWAVTAYNPLRGSFIETKQPFPSINALDNRVTGNADGSFDLYFGPEKPDKVNEYNWIQTNPGEGYLVDLRLYGPTETFFTCEWIPEDIVKI